MVSRESPGFFSGPLYGKKAAIVSQVRKHAEVLDGSTSVGADAFTDLKLSADFHPNCPKLTRKRKKKKHPPLHKIKKEKKKDMKMKMKKKEKETRESATVC